jgi:hypothetical protein
MGILGDEFGLRTGYYISVLLSFLAIPFIFMLPNDNPKDSHTVK